MQGNIPSAAFLSPGAWSLRLCSRMALVEGSQLPGCALLPLHPSIPLLSHAFMLGCQDTFPSTLHLPALLQTLQLSKQ